MTLRIRTAGLSNARVLDDNDDFITLSEGWNIIKYRIVNPGEKNSEAAKGEGGDYGNEFI